MLFTNETITKEEINAIENFFNEFETVELKTVAPEEAEIETTVSKYVSSLVTSCYAKSISDIKNTNTSNRVVRKRNLQQVMRESFFYGANRFGNNFIA